MVLDASGAIEFPLNTTRGKRLADEAEVVHVPHLIDVEISQVLRLYVLRGALSRETGSDGAPPLAELRRRTVST